MLYAATKATIRKAFDSSAVVDDIAATSKVNFSLCEALVCTRATYTLELVIQGLAESLQQEYAQIFVI